MNIQLLPYLFTVAKIDDISLANLEDEFTFIAQTDDEISLVCKTESTPTITNSEEPNWRGLKVCGDLDFSAIGIISRISSILAAEDIPIFVISTFNTDYFFVKQDHLSTALNTLEDENYIIVE
ncbi:MAG: ACT domain-containing protein [Clostridiales bacterium]